MNSYLIVRRRAILLQDLLTHTHALHVMFCCRVSEQMQANKISVAIDSVLSLYSMLRVQKIKYKNKMRQSVIQPEKVHMEERTREIQLLPNYVQNGFTEILQQKESSRKLLYK